MSTPTPAQTDTEAFREFLNQRIDDGLKDLSPEDAVRKFRDYQNELSQFVRQTQESINDGSTSSELDIEKLKQRAMQRIAELSENSNA